MGTLPTGTVTFLFTDIEGSTKLARGHADKWESLRARHHDILHEAIEANKGYVFQIIGDAFCAAFPTAGDAVRAAIKSQTDLYQENWGETSVKVRIGIHTGKADIKEDGQYQGYLAMSHIQRLMSAGHGGQTLVSATTQELLLEDLPEDVSLRDLGEKSLKDLNRPEHIYQLVIADLPVDFPALKTLDAYRHNLPVQLTSFIGREREMAEIKESISTHRLVTLIGVGGTGKTRLALQVAADLLDQFPDGAWFVELAPITDPELIPQTILSSLGIPEQPAITNLQLLLDYLRGKKLLLVMDNCEHLIEASAKLAESLVSIALDLKVLITSREALGLQGELIWQVPSLSLPDVGRLSNLEQFSQYEAVRLFIERATLVQSHFQVTNENAPAVAQICFRLDGIPLAIELAAARVRAMDVDQISKRLDDRFRLLTGGSRTALERQQTLIATLDWSYNLLSGNEKLLLCRLSVFVDGWTLEAAELVCGGGDDLSPYDILDLLTELVDKSLVILDGSHYHMLETTRHYAREKLAMMDEAESIRRRHAEYFAVWVNQMSMELRGGPTQLAHFEQLEADQGNVSAALERSLAGADIELGVRLAGDMLYYWWRQGHWFEWRHWLSRVEPHLDHVSEATRASALILMSAMEYHGNRNVDQGKQYSQAALEIFRRMGTRREIGWAIYWYAFGSFGNATEYSQAVTLLNEAIALFQAENDLAGVAQGYANLSVVASLNNDNATTKIATQKGLEIARAIGDGLREHNLLINLGIAELEDGDFETASIYFKQGLLWAKEHDNLPLILSGINLAALYWSNRADYKRTAYLFGAMEGLSKRLGVKLQIGELGDFEQSGKLARDKLGDQKFEMLRAEGRAMTVEQALEYALEETNE